MLGRFKSSLPLSTKEGNNTKSARWGSNGGGLLSRPIFCTAKRNAVRAAGPLRVCRPPTRPSHFPKREIAADRFGPLHRVWPTSWMPIIWSCVLADVRGIRMQRTQQQYLDDYRIAFAVQSSDRIASVERAIMRDRHACTIGRLHGSISGKCDRVSKRRHRFFPQLFIPKRALRFVTFCRLVSARSFDAIPDTWQIQIQLNANEFNFYQYTEFVQLLYLYIRN